MARMNRRQALCTFGALPMALRAEPREALPVAAVVTEYRRNSHADVIVGKILEGFHQDGGAGPALKVVSMYLDQLPQRDLGLALCKKHGVRVAKTIGDAVTMGTNKTQVAGVLSIGEHGNYPQTPDTRQRMYPRRRFFDSIAAALRRGGKVVPVFNDKHLAYNWKDAKHMHETAKQMGIPFLAGSSLPVTWRLPATSVPLGAVMEGAMGIGYGGSESYGFHALETLQCVVERRRGGETGIVEVQAVKGQAIEEARKAGRWSLDLLMAACHAAKIKADAATLPTHLSQRATLFLLRYRDGLRAAVAMINGVGNQFATAVKLRGQHKPLAHWFWLQDGRPYGHFIFLVKAIEHTIHTSRPAYPVERTLLTTGVLDRVMHSLHQNGRRFDTPELAIPYRPTDWAFANLNGKHPIPR